MAPKYEEVFTSRWALILATLGAAIGAGNIWRFPRMAAQNGGGAFIVAWIIALFLWSIPIIIIEFALGKKARSGVIGSFEKIAGKGWSWMGGFIGFCTMAIMFYYSVVMGWCLKYFLSSLTGELNQTNLLIFWSDFISGYQPIFFHFLAITLGVSIVLRGVVGGIEKANKIFIPLLFILLAAAALRAVTLPGSVRGLNFLFSPNWELLADHRVWLEAFSQSAWSVGPGWGLILTYAVYMKKNEDIVLNSLLTGLGNNSASLLAGMAVLCTLFAFLPREEAMQAAGAGNAGLTFVWLPPLFKEIPGGGAFISLFFLTLSFAALSSLVAMIELGVRIFMDRGMERKKAAMVVGTAGFLFGIPSAVSINVFNNQDWVWGVGLLVSGFLVVLAAIKYGLTEFREELINQEGNDIYLGRWYDYLVKYLIPLEFGLLIFWWFYQSITVYDTESWWNPFNVYSLGTCFFQWGLLMIIFIIFNRWIIPKIQ